MTPEIVAFTTAVVALAATDITLPGPPEENDVVLVVQGCDLFVGSTDDQGGIATAGYNHIEAPGLGEITPGRQVSWKRMGSTPDTVVSIYDTAGRGTSVAVIVYRNIDPDDALDDTPAEATGASGLPNAPSFTCATPNALRVAVGIIDRDDAVPTLPAGFTDLVYKQEGEAPFSATVMVAHRLEATPGALDPDAFGGTGDDNWWACHFAWKPAPDPAPAASNAERHGLIGKVGSLMGR